MYWFKKLKITVHIYVDQLHKDSICAKAGLPCYTCAQMNDEQLFN